MTFILPTALARVPDVARTEDLSTVSRKKALPIAAIGFRLVPASRWRVRGRLPRAKGRGESFIEKKEKCT